MKILTQRNLRNMRGGARLKNCPKGDRGLPNESSCGLSMKLVVGAIAVFSVAFGCFLACSSGYAHEHSDHMPADAKLGTISFEISCKSELQTDFNRAIAL